MLSTKIQTDIRHSCDLHNPFIIPTETVYGLAAIATDGEAVEKVYSIKQRPLDNPLICHFHSVEQIEQYIDVDKAPSWWGKLASKLSPGPVTYFLPISDLSELSPALAGSRMIGCRVPDHDMALEVLRLVEAPLAAPSANTSGRYSATNFDMVKADLGKEVRVCIDGGDSVIGIESTTIDCTHEHEIVIMRPGYISKNDIENILSEIGKSDVHVRLSNKLNNETTPGMKYKHYQPTTPLDAIQKHELENVIKSRTYGGLDIQDVAFLLITDEAMNLPSSQSIILPLHMKTIASHLYSSLYKLDTMKKAVIVCYVDQGIHQYKNDSLYDGLMNRLEKIV